MWKIRHVTKTEATRGRVYWKGEMMSSVLDTIAFVMPQMERKEGWNKTGIYNFES